jgi:hypothetical protein
LREKVHFEAAKNAAADLANNSNPEDAPVKNRLAEAGVEVVRGMSNICYGKTAEKKSAEKRLFSSRSQQPQAAERHGP